MSDHWFDRFTAPHTRREGLRAALAGAAATLPFATSSASAVPAKAAATSRAIQADCFQGCTYVSRQNYANTTAGCFADGYFGGGGAAALAFLVSPPLVTISNIVYQGRTRRCLDNARFNYRFDVSDCRKPNCNNFNPYEPGGPCDGCPAGYYCNPCPIVETGYICCVYKRGDCHGDCCADAGSGCP